jgi:hypothetical protein
MPKINVNDQNIDGFRVEVGWESERYVQVATTNLHSKIPLEENGVPETGETFKGWHITLSREGCNRAIRALRQARDAAFGADA